MTGPLDIRRRRIGFRCWHRGSREADLLLGRFAERCLPDLDAGGLDQLETLLEQPDPDIWDWVIGRKTVPQEFATPVMARLIELSNELRTR